MELYKKRVDTLRVGIMKGQLCVLRGRWTLTRIAKTKCKNIEVHALRGGWTD